MDSENPDELAFFVTEKAGSDFNRYYASILAHELCLVC